MTVPRRSAATRPCRPSWLVDVVVMLAGGLGAHAGTAVLVEHVLHASSAAGAVHGFHPVAASVSTVCAVWLLVRQATRTDGSWTPVMRPVVAVGQAATLLGLLGVEWATAGTASDILHDPWLWGGLVVAALGAAAWALLERGVVCVVAAVTPARLPALPEVGLRVGHAGRPRVGSRCGAATGSRDPPWAGGFPREVAV